MSNYIKPLEIKAGDTGRVLRAKLWDADRLPVDLSSATATFKCRSMDPAGNLSVLFEQNAVIESDGTGGANAVVTYDPSVEWMPYTGVYMADFKIYKGEQRTSFPEDDSYIEIHIVQD